MRVRALRYGSNEHPHKDQHSPSTRHKKRIGQHFTELGSEERTFDRIIVAGGARYTKGNSVTPMPDKPLSADRPLSEMLADSKQYVVPADISFWRGKAKAGDALKIGKTWAWTALPVEAMKEKP